MFRGEAQVVKVQHSLLSAKLSLVAANNQIRRMATLITKKEREGGRGREGGREKEATREKQFQLQYPCRNTSYLFI